MRLTTSKTYIHATVEYFLEEKEVALAWRYKTQDGEAHLSYQYEALAFWPTEVASYGKNQLLVSGKDELTGDTVIEAWLFSPPEQAPSTYIDTGTGETLAPYLSVPVTRKTPIYRSREYGTVQSMFKLQGTENKVLLQFWGPRDLFRLDLLTRNLEKVVSVTGDGDLPVLPELASTSSARWSRRHQAEGYVYYLGETAAEEGLFLMDHDLDGEIDEMSLLDYEAYYARLLDQALQYEAFY